MKKASQMGHVDVKAGQLVSLALMGWFSAQYRRGCMLQDVVRLGGQSPLYLNKSGEDLSHLTHNRC